MKESTKKLSGIASALFICHIDQFASVFRASHETGAFSPMEVRNALYATIMKIITDVPDALWDKMLKDIKPCSEDGCECHLRLKEMLGYLTEMRKHGIVLIAKKKGEQTAEM